MSKLESGLEPASKKWIKKHAYLWSDDWGDPDRDTGIPTPPGIEAMIRECVACGAEPDLRCRDA